MPLKEKALVEIYGHVASVWQLRGSRSNAVSAPAAETSITSLFSEALISGALGHSDC